MPEAYEKSRVALLRQVPLFAGLPENSLDDLAARTILRPYRPHTVIFNEGDEGDALYVVVSGSVRIERSQLVYDPTINEKVLKSTPLAWRRPADHFGEMALFGNEPRMADAITVDQTMLLRLNRVDFEHCLDTHPVMARAIITALSERLRQAADHLRSVQSLDVLGRLSELLLLLSEQYGQDIPSGGRRLKLKLTHEEIAEQLGIARESVSRAWSSLKQSGAVGKDGAHITILNTRRLRQNSML